MRRRRWMWGRRGGGGVFGRERDQPVNRPHAHTFTKICQWVYVLSVTFRMCYVYIVVRLTVLDICVLLLAILRASIPMESFKIASSAKDCIEKTTRLNAHVYLPYLPKNEYGTIDPDRLLLIAVESSRAPVCVCSWAQIEFLQFLRRTRHDFVIVFLLVSTLEASVGAILCACVYVCAEACHRPRWYSERALTAILPWLTALIYHMSMTHIACFTFLSDGPFAQHTQDIWIVQHLYSRRSL